MATDPSATSDLQSILSENPFILRRQQLIREIENNLSERLGKKTAVATYIANTLDPTVNAATSMGLQHITHLEDVIRTTKGNADSLALIVESFGGDVNFPLELLRRARTYYKEFRVIVVSIAKSAGTLLSLLADGVIATETASFGPIDPQLVVSTPQGATVISARSIKDMIEVTIPRYAEGKPQAVQAGIFATQNYMLYQASLDSINVVESLVNTHVLPKMKKEAAKELKEKLLFHAHSHGANVSADDLRSWGVAVDKVLASDQLADLLLEYHRRALRNMLHEAPAGQRGIILFESAARSLMIGGVPTAAPVGASRTFEAPEEPSGSPRA